VISGVVPVTFGASDPSGIQGALVHSESGVTLASVSQSCDFTSAVPCPQLPAGSLSVDTTRVPDGPHTFTLAATDAAGNTQTLASPSVIVDNDGPPAPSAFTATAVGTQITLAWTNPPSPPQPIASATVELCQATCSAPAAIPASGTGQITAPAPGTYTVHLWLLDSQGRGSATNAATATVTVATPTGGSTPPGGGGSTPPGSKPVTKPAAKLHTKLTATLKGHDLHVSGTLAALATGKVKVSWRSHNLAGTLGSGSRTVAVHAHKISLTFTLGRAARSGTIGVAVRSVQRILTGTLAKK
jgi:hypothetical protein